MASASKHWWGFTVKLNHAEACAWTKVTGGGSGVGDLVGKLGAAIGAGWWTGPIGLAVAAFILASSTYIRSLNQQSDGKGVNIKFSWALVYIGASRRGNGSSPCPQ